VIFNPEDDVRMEDRGSTNRSLSERRSFRDDYDKNKVTEEEIDLKLKSILSNKAQGRFLNPMITMHMEFFYNTLNFQHKNRTVNPFREPGLFPAFQKTGDVDDLNSKSSKSWFKRENEESDDELKRREQEVYDDLVDNEEMEAQSTKLRMELQNSTAMAIQAMKKQPIMRIDPVSSDSSTTKKYSKSGKFGNAEQLFTQYERVARQSIKDHIESES